MIKFIHSFIHAADDDDCWEPNHIAACLQALQAHNQQDPQQQQQQHATMAVSGIIRHTTPSIPQPTIPPTTGTRQSLPAAAPLTADLFLASNPHIQGSSLFVRLDKLLAAGGFNEWLPATTDRDVCIRLADVGVATAVTQQHTVHHFAPAAAAGFKPAAASGGLDMEEAAPHPARQQQQGGMASSVGCRILLQLQSLLVYIGSTMMYGGHA
jgi:hypothetical protein